MSQRSSKDTENSQNKIHEDFGTPRSEDSFRLAIVSCGDGRADLNNSVHGYCTTNGIRGGSAYLNTHGANENEETAVLGNEVVFIRQLLQHLRKVSKKQSSLRGA
jgi:hypothetical protein